MPLQTPPVKSATVVLEQLSPTNQRSTAMRIQVNQHRIPVAFTTLIILTALAVSACASQPSTTPATTLAPAQQSVNQLSPQSETATLIPETPTPTNRPTNIPLRNASRHMWQACRDATTKEHEKLCGNPKDWEQVIIYWPYKFDATDTSFYGDSWVPELHRRQGVRTTSSGPATTSPGTCPEGSQYHYGDAKHGHQTNART